MAEQDIDLSLDEPIQAYVPGPAGAPDEPDGNRPDDAETVMVDNGSLGKPVDLPAHQVTFAEVVSRADERRPIVPASLRSRAGRRSLLVLTAAYITHGTLFHLFWSWLYLLKLVWYGPWGFLSGIWRLLKWAWHPVLTELEQAAARTGDLDHGGRLARQAGDARRARFITLTAALIALMIAAVLVRVLAPWWVPWLAGAVALVVFARIGHPQDKPFMEQAFNASRFIRLTAELTRAALVATVISIKEPASIKFNREIYRDGPGYTAEVTLPTGVIAADVIDRRDYLAAGFQLPLAQVWPEPVRGAHPGVLAVWVADRPVDRMKQPVSPLLTCGQLDYFTSLPWGDDVRMRPLSWRLSERNSMFAGMAGSGKTLAARNVALAAALDPLVRYVISELKGSGDLDPLEVLCLPDMYASGADDRAKAHTMDILRWLDKECDRRGPAIRKWAAKGLNSQNKLNRAIAEADPSLFPLLAIFDEIQELITDPTLGKEAKRLLTSIIKRARALGIHLILSTQRIDKESVPKGISSNVHNRLCLAVPSHVETDLVLGTGAYSRGARPTTFVPIADEENPWAGWGYLAGRDQPVRANYIDNPTAEAIVARALAIRGGVADVDLRTDPDRDVLADVIRVFAHTNRPGLHWQQLAELLAADTPAVYAGITSDAISAQCRAEGIKSVNVTVDGVTLKGCRATTVQEVIGRREIGQ